MDPITIAMALGQLVPGIVKLVTGSDRAEEVAGKVVDIAKTVTGTAGGEEALAAIKADPDKLLAFRQEMGAQQADLEKAYLADRSDARKRDIALHQAGYRNVRADLMVLLDVVGLVACLATIAFYRSQLPGEVVGIISTVAGIFGACLRDAHQFEFGSSRGSAEKTALLAKADAIK